MSSHRRRPRPGSLVTTAVLAKYGRIKTRRNLTPYCERCGQIGVLDVRWSLRRGGTAVCPCEWPRPIYGRLPTPWKKAR